MPAYPMHPLRVIGILESCFKEKFGAPRQAGLVPAATARLRLEKEFIPEQSLRGLEGFSHVWLLSYLHLHTNKAFVSTVHPPRLGGRTVGVFASRAPHRPSPLGLSLARLLRVEGDVLHLGEVDLVDGTPILDVKPYIPAYDRAAAARAGWTAAAKRAELRVSFGRRALGEVGRLPRVQALRLKTLIAQALRHDPRNPRDRSQAAPGKILECLLMDYAVRFEIRGRCARVLGLASASREQSRRRVPAPVSVAVL